MSTSPNDALSSLTGGAQKGFIKHVFSFEDEDKGEMMNIVQYALIAVVPVILLNKTMQRYVPEADDEKSSLEIVAEILLQIFVMFLGKHVINRVVVYFPTYCGVKYPDFSVINIILSVLVIVLSLQTKLGEKVSILFDRISHLWDGTSGDNDAAKKKKGGNGGVKVSQPISQGSNSQMPPQMMSTPISQLPMNQMQMAQQPQQQAQQQDFGGYDMMGGGIMAANEMVGGAFANF
jgi:hypothetical protein